MLKFVTVTSLLNCLVLLSFLNRFYSNSKLKTDYIIIVIFNLRHVDSGNNWTLRWKAEKLSDYGTLLC